MGEYSYIVGGLFGLALFMVILGNLGAANDIYGDDFIVIDSEEMSEEEIPSNYDFDIEKIRFTPNFFEADEETILSQGLNRNNIINGSEIRYTEEERIYWTGNENDLNQSNGYVNFNVSDRYDTLYLRFNDASLFFRTVNTYVTDVNGTTKEVTGGSPRPIDLSGVGEDISEEEDGIAGGYEDLDKIEVLKIEITNTDSWVSIGNFARSTESGIIELSVIYLGNIIQSIREVISMLIGYLEFTAAVPGVIGTILRLYVGILILVVIAKEFWIG